jgi:hypothetical protein
MPLTIGNCRLTSWTLSYSVRLPLPRKLTFTDPEKIRELARRGLGDI